MKYFLRNGNSKKEANYLYMVGQKETWLVNYEMKGKRVVLNNLMRFEGELRLPKRNYKCIDKDDVTIIFQKTIEKVKELFLEE